MPELIEVEIYRTAAERVVGRSITGFIVADPDYLVGAPQALFDDLLIGARVTRARRTGKLLLLDLDNGATIGLRFGMTGRLVVDDDAPIDQLIYGATSGDHKWNRVALHFDDGGTLVVHDPRRLGSIEIDPDETKLGPDAAVIDAADLSGALGTSRTALKARLMDQAKLAGLGNLLTDEILWRSALDPTREAGSLTHDEIESLAATIRSTIFELSARGGSHTGDLQDERAAEPNASTAGFCPQDGAALRREKVGGRTTVWCPEHQR